MTKADLAKKIVADTGVSVNVAEIVLDSAIKNIKKSIVAGETVYLRGFGTFSRVIRKAKPARIIRDNASIVVPEHPLPVFKAGKLFKNEVK